MFTDIIEMFQLEFIRNALIAGLILAIICPMIGIFLVVRRLSLIAEALSHVSLSGVAAGLFLQKQWGLLMGMNPIFMGMIFSIFGSLFVERVRKLYHSYQELALPILLSGGIGIGVVLISAAGGFNADVAGYLFGSIVAIKEEQLIMTVIVGVIVLLFVLLFYKQCFSISFDEENAILTGIPNRMVNLFFIIIVALVISSAIQVVGTLLVSSLITIPVATSMQIASSFRRTMIYSIIFAELAVMIGFFAAYSLNLASGGAIVLVSISIWIVVVLYKQIRNKLNGRAIRSE
ncbi:metal ABC transporter permease [Thermoflavimicrobium daqui]|jgi:zinc transport system permease protein|uniref:Metal ABC transporter permease n=1 Tax=Thermoflavimicrobium daqui TaxID=2137476 RepID=A0A364K3N4_9BACL|nr:metal ABC transporter permease [Thermoflavimicrobium daqui]RAL23447.1 metal ABC transporter permease [Thermoflavimicrobium daqui]